MDQLFALQGITVEICARLHSDDLYPVIKAARLLKAKTALLNLYEYIFTPRPAYPRAYIEWPLKCYKCNSPMRHEFHDRICISCTHPFCKKCYRWNDNNMYKYMCDYCNKNSHECFACSERHPDYQMLLWCGDCNKYVCKDCTPIRCIGCNGKSICNCPVDGKWIPAKNNPNREYWCSSCLEGK